VFRLFLYLRKYRIKIDIASNTDKILPHLLFQFTIVAHTNTYIITGDSIMEENQLHDNVSNYPYVIEMMNITKEFPGIIANDNITLQLKRGEIHALLGENGAGKSTLMSVLFGMYKPEQGTILKDGKIVNIESPNDATELGIGMVHQHFKLVECFTVLDNIILGAETTRMGFILKISCSQKSQ
jgi:ABC-type uncharacterized transport systems, ATPase components